MAEHDAEYVERVMMAAIASVHCMFGTEPADYEAHSRFLLQLARVVSDTKCEAPFPPPDAVQEK